MVVKGGGPYVSFPHSPDARQQMWSGDTRRVMEQVFQAPPSLDTVVSGVQFRPGLGKMRDAGASCARPTVARDLLGASGTPCPI